MDQPSATTPIVFYYLDFNSSGSPPVVLLHGLGSESTAWGYQIPLLCEAGFRPLAPDLPGFGKTLAPEGRWSIGTAARDVARWMVMLDLPPAIVVGISMGGAVALQLALDNPRLLQKLILVSTFARLWPKHLDEVGFLLGRFVIAQVRGKEYQAEMVARRMFPKAEQEGLRQALVEQILHSNERVYRQAMRSLALFDVRQRLHEIHAPTLVISGENDSTVPLANQIELARGIAGSQHVIIPNAGHAVVVEQYSRFNTALIDFLNNQRTLAED